MSEYFKIIEKIECILTRRYCVQARHIVSAASSGTEIGGALQHHVLFICRENDGRYQSLERNAWGLT